MTPWRNGRTWQAKSNFTDGFCQTALKNLVAAKVEIDSVKSNSIVVVCQGWTNHLFVAVLQFPDFSFIS